MREFGVDRVMHRFVRCEAAGPGRSSSQLYEGAWNGELQRYRWEVRDKVDQANINERTLLPGSTGSAVGSSVTTIRR